MSKPTLKEVRRDIDALDAHIIQILLTRQHLSALAQSIRKKHTVGDVTRDNAREAQVALNYIKGLKGMKHSLARHIAFAVIDGCYGESL